MNKKRRNTLWSLVAFVVFLLGVYWLISFADLTGFVESFGIKNVYLSLFFIGLVGGVSSFTAAAYAATIASLALVGVDPFIMALVVAPSLTLGDIILYYVLRHGRDVILSGNGHAVARWADWIQNRSKTSTNIGILVYSLTPLPGDLLMLALAVVRYPLRYWVPVVLLGDYLFVLILAFGSIWGWNLVY